MTSPDAYMTHPVISMQPAAGVQCDNIMQGSHKVT